MANTDEEALRQALSGAQRRGLVLRDLELMNGGATARCWAAQLLPGRRVVLKVQAGTGDFPVVADAVQAVDLLPPGLLPLPKSLDYGELPGFGWYAVTEMLPGRRVDFLSPARLGQVLALNRRQTGQRQARGVDWPARVHDALNPRGRAWTKLAAASSHGRALREIVFANPVEPIDISHDDLVLGDLNLRNVLFEQATDQVSGLVDVETTLGFGCRSLDLAPLLVDWHRARVRVQLDPTAIPPDPAVAKMLRDEISAIGGHKLIACVVTHRLVEGANWAVDHGLEDQLPFWCAAAYEALWSQSGTGRVSLIKPRRPEPDAVR